MAGHVIVNHGARVRSSLSAPYGVNGVLVCTLVCGTSGMGSIPIFLPKLFSSSGRTLGSQPSNTSSILVESTIAGK